MWVLLGLEILNPATAPQLIPQTLVIKIPGSHQNPTVSVDGTTLAFTVWTLGYNRGPADIYLMDRRSGQVSHAPRVVQVAGRGAPLCQLVAPARRDFGHPPGDERAQSSDVAAHAHGVRAKLGPAGGIVFESHPVDVARKGRITGRAGGSYRDLTGKQRDCRQPSWSPAGEWIVYQCRGRKTSWDLWLIHPDGTGGRAIADVHAALGDGRVILSGRRVGGLQRRWAGDVEARGAVCASSLGWAPASADGRLQLQRRPNLGGRWRHHL